MKEGKCRDRIPVSGRKIGCRPHNTACGGRGPVPGRKGVSGSFTVEAAFVVPMVIFVCVLVIYTALYLHDVTVARAGLGEVLSDAGAYTAWDVSPGSTKVIYEYRLERSLFSALTADDSGDRESIILEYAKKRLSEGLLVSSITEVGVDISDAEISISFEISGARNSLIAAFMPEMLFRKNLSGKTARDDNTIPNRLVTATLRIGKKIKGAETVIDKLNELLERFGK